MWHFRPWQRAALIVTLLVLPLLGAPAGRATDNVQTFPETGQSVRGPFLSYWQSHGGLAQQGYPLSGELTEPSPADGKPYMVQYFERAVFERHPENAAPFDVLLSQLGTFRYRQRYPQGAPGQQISDAAGTVRVPETGMHLGGHFLAYWQAHGGLAQQGYPISNEFDERSDLDGKTYRVQYFERAVFEYHPEIAAPYDVLLAQLGRSRLQAKQAASPPAAAALPAPLSANLPSSVQLSALGPAPEITGISEWINSSPLTLRQLRGKVVLVHFWTFACINCIHVQPYVKSWYTHYKDAGFVVLGIHTPELSFEKDINNVRGAVRDAGVTFPVAFDPKYATWNAYNNGYWPSFFYVDKAGQIRYTHIGEGDYDGQEQVIRQLLQEPAP